MKRETEAAKRKMRLESLRAEIQKGVDDMNAGRFISGEDFEKRRMEERKARARKEFELLRAEIQKAVDDLNAGRFSPGEEVFARLRARRQK